MNLAKEIDIFNRAALLVHEESSFDGLSQNLLRALRLVAPGDISLVNWVGMPGSPLVTLYDPPESVSDEINAGVHRNLHDHPTYGRRTGRAMCISDIFSASRWHNTGLYDEGHGRAGQEDDIGLDFDLGGGRMLTLCVTRGRRGFAEAERRMFDLLAPHVRLAFGRMRATDEAPVARLRTHRLEVDRDGRIRDLESGARATLENFLGAKALRGDRLPDAIVRWLLHGIDLAGVREEHSGSPPAYRLGRPDRVLSFALIPSGRARTHTVVIEERIRHTAPRTGTPSPRERELLIWLAQGKSNAEIAAILGISAGTVKRHLENIYAKLGVEGRHGAVARALRDGLD